MPRNNLDTPGAYTKVWCVQRAGCVKACKAIDAIVGITLHLGGMDKAFTILGAGITHDGPFAFEIVLEVIVCKRFRALFKRWALHLCGRIIKRNSGNGIISLIVHYLPSL